MERRFSASISMAYSSLQAINSPTGPGSLIEVTRQDLGTMHRNGCSMSKERLLDEIKNLADVKQLGKLGALSPMSPSIVSYVAAVLYPLSHTCPAVVRGPVAPNICLTESRSNTISVNTPSAVPNGICIQSRQATTRHSVYFSRFLMQRAA